MDAFGILFELHVLLEAPRVSVLITRPQAQESTASAEHLICLRSEAFSWHTFSTFNRTQHLMRDQCDLGQLTLREICCLPQPLQFTAKSD